MERRYGPGWLRADDDNDDDDAGTALIGVEHLQYAPTRSIWS